MQTNPNPNNNNIHTSLNTWAGAMSTGDGFGHHCPETKTADIRA